MFDELGVRWEYEPLLAELERGWYVPDFWLANVGDGWWFEVKGPEPVEARPWELLEELAATLNQPVALAWGDMPTRPLDRWGQQPLWDPQVERDIAVFTPGSNVWDHRYEFCTCACGQIGLEYEARIERTCSKHVMYDERVWEVSKAYLVAQGLC